MALGILNLVNVIVTSKLGLLIIGKIYAGRVESGIRMHILLVSVNQIIVVNNTCVH